MDATHIQILKIIQLIRESFDGAVDVYSQGSCVKFAMILKEIYPQGVILWDCNHAIFEYDGMCFDINGIAKKKKIHTPLIDYGLMYAYSVMNLKWKKK
jgi:hypothetical protein